MRICIVSMILIVIAVAALFACANPGANVPQANAPTPSKASPAKIVSTEPTPVPTPDTAVQVNKDPKKLVESFYEYYLEDTANQVMKGNERIFLNYLTVKFYDEAEKIEAYDPFFDVPEFAGTYKDLKISDAVIKGNKATVDVEAKAQSATWIVKVSLLKKSGMWKIDAIKHDLKNQGR